MARTRPTLTETPSQTAGPYVHIGMTPNFCGITGVIDADPGWDDARLKAHHRALVLENHPDRLIARGVPEEFVRIATERLAAINIAWESIERQRRDRRRKRENRQ